jgi:hypothetical protein
MEFMVNIDLRKSPKQIRYSDKILLTGSCFTEHIGNSLADLKFSTLQNPNGILFDPHSVSKSLLSYVECKQYHDGDFFQLNEVWHSWDHHSRFSNTDLREAVRIVNESQKKAHGFLKHANWIIITLGSSFSYRLTPGPSPRGERGQAVANCHRAPAQWFNKQLMPIEKIVSDLEISLQRLFEFNPNLNIIFTVSPVRHIRDGVIDNNRSKARLIEAVHCLVDKYNNLYYFPAYELVIDVLRDYRFYDVDLVHPNYMATEFVLEKFAEACVDDETRKLMNEVQTIVTARKHKAFQPETQAHKQFLKTYFERSKELKRNYPFLDLEEEMSYFSS